MASKQQVVGVVAIVAIAATVIWLVTRGGSKPSPLDAATASGSATTNSTTSSGNSAATAGDAGASRARKIASEERAKLIATIRERYRQRSSASAGAGTPNPSGPPPALPEVPIDKEYIRASVRELIPLLGECYQQGLERNPQLSGNVVVNFTIEGEPGVGAVIGESKVDDAKSDLADVAVRECIQETMHAIQMDAPPGGGTVRVTYPFAFAPE